ncbi:MAG TPA: DUF308 domain-containing protein [Pseudonocardiaceae bacterium]
MAIDVHGVRAGTELRRLLPWWSPLLSGALSVVFGVVVLVWPDAGLFTFAVLTGAWLVTLGVSRLVGAFYRDASTTTGQHVLSGLIGVLYIVGGVLCLRDLVLSLALISALVALQWLLAGIADVSIGIQVDGGQRVWLIVAGVLSFVLGIVLISLPGLSLAVFLVFVAAGALVMGVTQIAAAVRLRSLEHR